MHRPSLLFVLLGVCLLSACASDRSAGYGPVRIETYPLDGTCRLAGNGYTMMAKAPADLVVPLTAAPVTVTCETESGYRGTETLKSNYDPWSPGNVGSLGLGYLVDKSAGSGRRYPELLRLTMVYTEAGKPEVAQMLASDKSTEKKMPEQAGTTGDAAPGMKSDKMMPDKRMTPEKMMAEKAMSEGKAMESEAGGLPAPPSMEKKDTKIKEDVLAMKPTESATPKAAAKMTEDVLAMKPTPRGGVKDSGLEMAAVAGARIHLSSFKEKANAERNWKVLARRHRSLLTGLTPSIETVDLGRKGTFHRVYAGPVKDDKAARDLCKALKKQKAYCRPVAAGAK